MSEQHLREEKVSSLELFKGQFLHALRDVVKLPDGKLASREYVLHPGAAMVVPLLDDGAGNLRIVLERQFRYPLDRVMIEFPAGKLDKNEDSLHCAKRELREETGYCATHWALAGRLHPVISYSTEFIDIWFARGLTSGAQHLDEGEFLDVMIATPHELFEWCRDGHVTDAKTISAAMWLQNFLTGAWSLTWHE
jgi:ADP-ribose pyrophosphatase